MKPVLAIRHQPHCPLGSVADVLAAADLPYRYVDLFDAVPERLPLEDAAGLVVLGGTMSANDVAEYPFLAVELDWLRQAVGRGVPVLGICLGAQLLAKALGGRVYRNPVKEIGWFDVKVLPAAADDRLFRGRGKVETVFHWHGDTFDLPADAVLLASTPTCRQQAFRCGPRAYGLQFHVEMTPDLLEEWLTRRTSSRNWRPTTGSVRRRSAPRRPHGFPP